MNTQQQQSLVLADDLDDWATQMDMGRKPDSKSLTRKAAAELRRLQSVNADLLEALKDIVGFWDNIVPTDAVNQMHINARAAIAKATTN